MGIARGRLACCCGWGDAGLEAAAGRGTWLACRGIEVEREVRGEEELEGEAEIEGDGVVETEDRKGVKWSGAISEKGGGGGTAWLEGAGVEANKREVDELEEEEVVALQRLSAG